MRLKAGIMKHFIFVSRTFCILFLLVSLLAASCKKTSKQTVITPNPTPPVIPPADTPKSYKLAWSDEFDTPLIDTANWNFETGGSGWGNHEQEYYQQNNASILNGNLVITASKENVSGNSYTSSRMTTLGKHEFTYGKFEARISMPVGQGLWPAFWLLGANINSVGWPECGETDIMEHINSDNLVYGTIHWNNNGHVSFGGNTSKDSLSNFHIYTLEWDANAIKWSVDGIQFREADIHNNINNTTAFHRPFFIILDLAVGGDWPGQTVDDSKFPASMLVDYVRVYQRK